LHCAEQKRFRVLQTIFFSLFIEPDVNLDLFRAGAVARLMGGREASYNCLQWEEAMIRPCARASPRGLHTKCMFISLKHCLCSRPVCPCSSYCYWQSPTAGEFADLRV